MAVSTHPPSMKGHSPTFWIALLALVFGMQPVTTDLYLPTLPTLATQFKVSAQAIESTLQTYLISFAVVQLFIGPFADRFGRKPVLVTALAIYALASFAGISAQSLGALNMTRVFQAVGVCAVIISARATVRDLLPPVEGARLLSKALSFMGIVALLSPLIGGLVKDYIGWQYCFAVMGLYATSLMILILVKTPETIPAKSFNALHFGPLFRNYIEISQHKIFLLYALVSTGSYSALMIFFVKSPVLLIKEFGFNPFEFGITIAFCSVGFIVGTLIGRRLLGFQSLNKALLVGASIAFSATMLMVLLTQTSVLATWQLGTKISLIYIGCQIIYMLGHGILQPISQSAAIGPFPTKAGAAGAVLGFIIHTGAALWIAGFGTISPAVAWPIGVCLAASIIFFAALSLYKRTIQP